MTEIVDPQRELLRHTLATLAYRGGKALRGAPEGFGAFDPGHGCRTPAQILAHIGDLFDWAVTMCNGEAVWHDATPQPWPQEVDRFFATLRAFDARLRDPRALASTPEKIFQGPIADALTHIGQIGLLRRQAQSPVKGESYFRAEITTGRVGRDQAAPVREF
jgi:hypothetical protein